MRATVLHYCDSTQSLSCEERTIAKRYPALGVVPPQLVSLLSVSRALTSRAIGEPFGAGDMVIVGSSTANMPNLMAMDRQCRHEAATLSPLIYSLGVNNIASSSIGLAFGFSGSNYTLLGALAGVQALYQAQKLIETGCARRVLVLSSDYFDSSDIEGGCRVDESCGLLLSDRTDSTAPELFCAYENVADATSDKMALGALLESEGLNLAVEDCHFVTVDDSDFCDFSATARLRRLLHAFQKGQEKMATFVSISEQSEGTYRFLFRNG